MSEERVMQDWNGNKFFVTKIGKEVVLTGIDTGERKFPSFAIIPDEVTRIGLPDSDHGIKITGTSLLELGGNGVKNISANAFKGTNIARVALPEALVIGDNAFEGSGVREVYADKVNIVGDRAFLNCNQLIRCSLKSVTSMGDCVFSGCGIQKKNLLFNQNFKPENNNIFGTETSRVILGTHHDKFFVTINENDVILTKIDRSNAITQRLVGNPRDMSKPIFERNRLTNRRELIKRNPYDTFFTEHSSEKINELEIPDEITTIGLPDNNQAIEIIGEAPEELYANGVINVSANAFNGTHIKKVSLPAALAIGNNAFENSKVETLEANKVATVGNKAFSNCNRLGYCSLESVTEMGDYVFSGCDRIEKENLHINPEFKPGKNTFAVDEDKVIGEVFGNRFSVAKNGEDVILTGIDTRKGDAKNVFIPDKVTTIGLSDNEHAIEIIGEVPEELYAKGVTNVSANAFKGTPVKKVNLPEALAIGDNAFENSKVETLEANKVATVGDKAFLNCSQLKYCSLDNVTEMGDYVFSGCSRIEKKNLHINPDFVPGENTFTELDEDRVIEGEHGNKFFVTKIGKDVILTGIDTSEGNESTVVVPDEVTRIGLPDSDHAIRIIGEAPRELVAESVKNVSANAFKETHIRNINLPEALAIDNNAFENSDLEALLADNVIAVSDRAFLNCDELQSCRLDGVIAMGDYVFSGCDGIEQKNIHINPNFTPGENTFAEVGEDDGVALSSSNQILGRNIEKLDGEYGNKFLVTKIGKNVILLGIDTRHGDASTVVVPDEVTIIGISDSNRAIGDTDSKHDVPIGIIGKIPETLVAKNVIAVSASAFKGIHIRNVNLPEALVIGNNAFENSKVKILHADKVRNIGSNAFENSKVKILHADEALTVGDRAFLDCSNLKECSLNSVLAMGEYVFSGCNKLSENNLHINPNFTPISENTFAFEVKKDKGFGLFSRFKENFGETMKEIETKSNERGSNKISSARQKINEVQSQNREIEQNELRDSI